MILFIGISIFSIFLLPRLEVNPNLDRYIPEKSDNRIFTQQLDSIFGGSEMILVMLQAEDVVNQATRYACFENCIQGRSE